MSIASSALSPVRPDGAGLAHWLPLAARPAALLQALEELQHRVRTGSPAATWIHLCPPEAWQAQLQQLRARLAQGADALQRYPLLGVPFALKDNIDVEGQPTSAACPAFTRVAARSATVVQRLLDAGALWVGKTNLDQFATGLVGTRSPYGRPCCVDDPARISGGSSSGSAVAVASGLAAFALGTDTAGSGRVPAAFNGLVGLKPTPGRVGTAGVVPACRSLDCVSVFAHTVDDAARVLAVIEGPDAADDYSAFVPGAAVLPARRRIGVPRAPLLDAALGYDTAWQAALGRLRDEGHALVELDFAPLFEVAALLYDGPWVAERHAVIGPLLARDPGALDPAVRRVVERALDLNATQAFEGQYRLQALRAPLAALWQQVDQLMVPSVPTHPTFAEVDADPLGVNARLGTYTNFVNLLGWCAAALPAGRTRVGLPFGVTMIAPGGADAALANAWRHWTPGPPLPPGPRPAVRATLPLAVVGAHLSGLPLNGQLTERGATLREATHTAPCYRLYALPGTTPPKPGLLRVAEGGAAIALEVWELPLHAVGSFLAAIPPPLGLGSVQLADGSHVHGFLCEPHALAGARDISAFGGWRAFLQSLT
ncbi:MAG: allophanate hydrolase [Rubrivivax sp.]